VNLMRLLIVTVKAITRNGFRTFLTMLGIIIGVGSVIAMMAIGEGARKDIQDSIASMGSNMLFIFPRRGEAKAALWHDDYEALREECEYLAAVTPSSSQNVQAIYGANNWSTSVNGINPSYLTIRKMEIASGEMFSERDAARGAKVCVVGQTVVENLFDGADPVGAMIRFNRIPFRVVGVLAEKGQNSHGSDQDDIILAPFLVVQKRINATNKVRRFYASVVDESKTELAIAEVEEILRRKHKLRDEQESDFEIRSQQELGSTMDSTSRMMTILLSTIAGISLFVGGIGIMNIMYVSVTERTREIGLRMAVGAQGIDIMLQFLFEAILISVTGGLLGMILGVSVVGIIDSVLEWPTVIQPASIVLSFAVCVVTGVFFGWYPAIKASRLDPIEALRFE
jgi:putative ABC transport system permease protein